MKRIEISAKELIFMASYLGAEEFFGIPDPFFGIPDNKIRAEMDAAKTSLAERRYAKLDFEGFFSPGEMLVQMSEICAHCARYVSVDIMEKGINKAPKRFYFYGDCAVKLSGVDSITLEIVSGDDIETELLSLAVKYAPKSQELSEGQVTLPLSVIAKAQAASDIADVQQAYLINTGCPKAIAAVIVDGFQKQADYCAVTLTDFERKSVDSVICLHSAECATRIVSVKTNDGDCWTLTQVDTQTLRTAISALLSEALQ